MTPLWCRVCHFSPPRFHPPVRPSAKIAAHCSTSPPLAGVQSLPADAHIDGSTLLNALFSAEALQDDKAFGNAIDAFSSACRRKRIL